VRQEVLSGTPVQGALLCTLTDTGRLCAASPVLSHWLVESDEGSLLVLCGPVSAGDAWPKTHEFPVRALLVPARALPVGPSVHIQHKNARSRQVHARQVVCVPRSCRACALLFSLCACTAPTSFRHSRSELDHGMTEITEGPSKSLTS